MPRELQLANEARALRVLKRMVEQEQVRRALRLSERIDVADPSPDMQRELQLIRLECYLITRDFEKIRTATKCLESVDSQPTLRDLVLADASVLSGNVRQGIRVLAPIVRRNRERDEIWARGCLVAGLACYRTGHYRWARKFLQDSAAFYRLHRRVRYLVRALISLSLVAKSEGNIELALHTIDDAMEMLPRSGLTKTRLRLHLNRGIYLLKLGRLTHARIALMQASHHASEAWDTFLLVSVYNNLGHVYRFEGNCSVSKEFHERALVLARESASARQECLSLEFLGETLLEAGDHGRALEVLNEAFQLAKILAPQGDLMMEVLRRRGEALAGLRQTNAAREDLEKACRLCKRRGEKREYQLASRALTFLMADSTEDLAEGVCETLAILKSLGDQFEYSRTVYFVLADGRLSPADQPWLVEAVATAQHYFGSTENKHWAGRLRLALGPARQVSGIDRADSRGVNEPTETSEPFQRMREAIKTASRGMLPVLIVGETGVGKESVAQAIHQSSSRSDGPMLAINCGAIPEALVESELFGHVQGAYTGATREKIGLLETVQGGSILLDEIGDLPGPAQVKLLRFLDTGEVRRVGETRVRHVDVRVLASTNKNLAELAERDQFRKDLLYRLNAFRVNVPPLRDRKADIIPLAEHFLASTVEPSRGFVVSARLAHWLREYSWPGNIRELRNLCGYLGARAWGEREIDVVHLPEELRRVVVGNPEGTTPFHRDRMEFERNLAFKALTESRGSISGAARILGIGRNTLAQRMRAYGWTRTQFTTSSPLR